MYFLVLFYIIIWPSGPEWIQYACNISITCLYSLEGGGVSQAQRHHARLGFLYLNDAAPARCCLHRVQEDGVGVLAATGEDDTAAPSAGRPRWDAVRRSVAAQPVSISITLRHVDEERGLDSKHRERKINQLVGSDPNKV